MGIRSATSPVVEDIPASLEASQTETGYRQPISEPNGYKMIFIWSEAGPDRVCLTNLRLECMNALGQVKFLFFFFFLAILTKSTSVITNKHGFLNKIHINFSMTLKHLHNFVSHPKVDCVHLKHREVGWEYIPPLSLTLLISSSVWILFIKYAGGNIKVNGFEMEIFNSTYAMLHCKLE